MTFDRVVLDVAISALESLRGRLHDKGIDNPRLTAEGTLASLKAVRQNDSLRPEYETIFNQALVLLVSYFASAVHDVFRRAIAVAVEQEGKSPLLREELKLTIADLKEVRRDFTSVVPELLIQSKDVSFQDMQSISRSFKSYLGIHIDRDSDVNDIILGQGCRHVIVHTGGIVDDKLIRQLRDANPRSVQKDLKVGSMIQFQPAEVSAISKSMARYVDLLHQKVKDAFATDV